MCLIPFKHSSSAIIVRFYFSEFILIRLNSGYYIIKAVLKYFSMNKLIIIIVLHKTVLSQAVLQLSNPIASQSSDYQFSITLPTQPSNEATVKILFPGSYLINNNINTLACSIQMIENQCIVLTSITNWKSFTILGLNNPQYNQTISISIQISDQSITQTLVITQVISLNQIVKYDFTFGSKYTFSQTYLDLKFTSDVADIDQIIIEFPYLNLGASNLMNMVNSQTTCLLNKITTLSSTLIYPSQLSCNFSSPQSSQILISFTPIITPNIENVLTQIKCYTLKGGNYMELIDATLKLTQTAGQLKQLQIIPLTIQMLEQTSIQVLLTPQLSFPIGSSINLQLTNSISSINIFNSQIRFSQGFGININNAVLRNNQIFLHNAVTNSGPQTLTFSISNIQNPIAVNSMKFQVFVSYDNSLIETSIYTYRLTNTYLPFIKLQLSNTTYSSQTMVTLFGKIDIQYPSTSTITIILPKQTQLISCPLQFCLVDQQQLILSNYFLTNQNLDLTLQIQLQNTLSCTDNFQIFIKNNGDLISQLNNPLNICTTQSIIKLISFQPQLAETSAVNDYVLTIEIPQISNGSQIQIDLPEFYSTQLNQCSGNLNNDLKQIISVRNQKIIGSLEKGGTLNIICSLKNQRVISQYSYQISGQITFEGQVLAVLNQSVQVQIIKPDIINSISVLSNNLQMTQKAMINISFTYTLLATDQIVITVPFSQIVSCIPICQIIENQTSSNISMNSTNEVIVNVINPSTNLNLNPFNLFVYNNDRQVAQGVNIEGILGPLTSTITDFNVSLSSYFLGERVSLSLSFQNIYLVTGPSQALLTLPQQFLNIYNLSCDTTFCSQQLKDGQTQLQFTSLTGFQVGINAVTFNGLQISVPHTQIYAFQFSLFLCDQFGIIYSGSDKLFNFNIICNQNCAKCSKYSSECTQCNKDQYLFQNSCLNTCPQYYYQMPNSSCGQCKTPSQCFQCNATNPKYCIQCKEPYVLQNGVCFENRGFNGNQSNSILSQFPNQKNKQLFDGIPIFCIFSGIFLVLCIAIKIYKRKEVIFFKIFWQFLTLLELIACLIRIIRFSFYESIGYIFLSIGLLGLYCFQQLQNGYNLINIVKAYPEINHRTKRQKTLLYFSYYYQWKIFIRYVRQSDCKLYEELIIKIRAQNSVLVLQIIVLGSYLKISQDTLSIDDLVYSILLLMFQLADRFWQQSENTILPESEDPQRIYAEDQPQN